MYMGTDICIYVGVGVLTATHSAYVRGYRYMYICRCGCVKQPHTVHMYVGTDICIFMGVGVLNSYT